MFEETRAAQSAAGPEFDRLREREAELLREARRHKDERTKFDARTTTNFFANDADQGMHLKASAVPPNLTRDFEAKIESQKTEFQVFKELYSQHRTLWSVGTK